MNKTITSLIIKIMTFIILILSCFTTYNLYEQKKENEIIQEDLGNCLVDVDRLTTEKESLMIDVTELNNELSTLNEEKEKLQEEIKTLKKN